jgi:ribosomal protein S18 acetylase RimI-like enzyme
MNAADRYRQVAALHARCLDRSFLATLGEGFLARMYRAIDEAPGAIFLTEERGGRVVGFITGGTGMGPIYRRMMRRPVGLGMALMPAFLSPSRLRRIVEILRYSNQSGLPAGTPDAELLSLAVAPEWRGRAIADALYDRLLQGFQQQGVVAFRIIVGAALAPAHRFYQRMGAQPVGDLEVHAGESSTVYVHRV